MRAFMSIAALLALSACAGVPRDPIPTEGVIRSDVRQYGCPSMAEAFSPAHKSRCAIVSGAPYRVIDQGPGWALVEVPFEDGWEGVYIKSDSAAATF